MRGIARTSALSHRPFLFWRATAVGALAAGIVAAATMAAEDRPPADAGIAARLAAGEFGPARDLATRASDAQQRDAWLGRIAAAQLRSGARLAALDTVAEIGNDETRSRAYAAIGARPLGNPRGGAAMADFDTLIELITSTVSPDTWDAVGGPGAIEPFPTGVFVDAAGLMRQMDEGDSAGLADIRSQAGRFGENRDARKTAGLRKVSLTRLEREAQRLWALGMPPDASMRVLAGLRQVRFVLVFPDTRDVVLAGPAGDWTIGGEERVVGADDGRPVLQLDDLVVLMRNAFSERQGRFGCSIAPREANLAAVQTFLRKSAGRSLRPGERGRWLAELRDCLGRQDIRVHGVDPRSRVARVIVAADYHMKLIGMGLREGTLGVSSYLDSAAERPADAPLDVLRWWFALNYDMIRATKERDAFELPGPGVKVLSENELLAAHGRRVHTGESDALNAKFARDFTEHFADLAVKYPIYAELRNVFDLALVAALIRGEKLAERADWHWPFFADDGQYQVDCGAAPTEVESVVNCRLVDNRRLVAGVSGGVSVDASDWVGPARVVEDRYGQLRTERGGARPDDLPRGAWWWD